MWPSPLVTLLASALKCAFLCCRLGPYSAISLELCKLEAAEEGNVWGNLMLLLPEPEPSLTGKSERASAANATKGWIKLLEGDQQAVEEVDLTGFASCLDITLPQSERFKILKHSQIYPIIWAGASSASDRVELQ